MSFLRELWEFLHEREKYYLWPIVIVLLLVSVIIVLAQGTVVAPAIYTLF